MSDSRFPSLLGWVACGRGLRRSKQAFHTMTEYDVWVSDRDANEPAHGRPDRDERIQQLTGNDDRSRPVSSSA